MNTVTEHERKLAETLSALALAPAARTSHLPRKARRGIFIAGTLLLITALLFAATSWVGGLGRLQTQVLDRLNLTEGWTIPGFEAETALPVAQPKIPDKEAADRTTSAATGDVTGSGYVVAPRSTTVFSKYEGRITRVAVDIGDHVEAGEALVTLDDVNARFQLDQAKAAKVSADLELAARHIDLAQTQTSLDRIEVLAQRKAVSRQQLEDARVSSESALNGVAQARQQQARAELDIRIAQERIDELTVRAPFAGVVVRLNAHFGDTVLARADSVREGQSLLTLTDTGSMVIDADVAESSIAKLRRGLRGEAVLDGFPDRPFSIELARLSPIASAEKGTIGLRFSLVAPPEGIRPNMAARIRITLPDLDKLAGETEQ